MLPDSANKAERYELLLRSSVVNIAGQCKRFLLPSLKAITLSTRTSQLIVLQVEASEADQPADFAGDFACKRRNQ